METYRGIPNEYMTVGEIAKKMGVTVRTLQYYDKEGLFSPSAESEGGRRLYSNKDLIKLHQILSLKYLGFSLNDIKNRFISLDTPLEVANVLAEQASDIRSKIDSLSESLKEIEMLRAEVVQIQSVDFNKYADIIANLRLKNDFYWLIKYFDEEMLDHIRVRFDQKTGIAFMEHYNDLIDKIIELKTYNIAPDSEKAQCLAKKFWEMVMDFTDGDMSMLPKLIEMGDIKNVENKWEKKQKIVIVYIQKALEVYFTKLGVNPFEGESI